VSDIEVVQLPNGQFVENCWLVADRSTGDAVLIDPGEEPGRFLAQLAPRRWTLRAIWLTHAHIDHVLGVGAVKLASGVPIYLHPLDRTLYESLPTQATWFGLRADAPPPPDVALAEGDQLTVGRLRFDVRHTPGHSPGSVSFVGHGRVFGGDVLFSGSVGRTDLPGGDHATLMASLQHVFLALPDSTVVHSGHGPDTTIGVERLTNPFLTGAYRLDG
jgi:glyoxylase-like metal-dependent hydrolase (beta-lactamase superfamily II)